MSEPVFKSKLTPEEIEANFQHVDFFSGLMDGLQDALDYTRGQPSKTTVRERSTRPVNLSSAEKQGPGGPYFFSFC